MNRAWLAMLVGCFAAVGYIAFSVDIGRYIDRLDAIKDRPIALEVGSYVFKIDHQAHPIIDLEGSLLVMNDFEITTELSTQFSGIAAGVIPDEDSLVVVTQTDRDLISKVKFAAGWAADDIAVVIKQVIHQKDLPNVGLLHVSEADCSRVALARLDSGALLYEFPCILGPSDPNLVGGGYTFVENVLFLAIGDPDRTNAELGWPRFDESLAQSSVSPYGKILKITNWREFVLGQVEDLGILIFASGLRNPQGMTVGLDGSVYVTDHGAAGGDEVNLVAQGNNFGWPLVSLGKTYRGGKFPGVVGVGSRPLFSWVPSIAPSDVSMCPRIFSERYPGLDCIMVSSLRAETLFFLLIKEDRVGAHLINVQELRVGHRLREISHSSYDSVLIATDSGAVVRMNFQARN